MALEPSVPEIVEAAFDIALENPCCRALPSQQIERAGDGVLCASTPTKTIGVRIGPRFSHRLQTLQMQSLLSPIHHGGDSQWAYLRKATALGDVHPAQWLRSKTGAAQPLDGLPLSFRGGPDLAIHARCSLAIVFSTRGVWTDQCFSSLW